ncbi:hypothetical protein Ciccas_004807 [Cichlidogyrus casuarinus]|uniref:Uncharacterized protein n=1 Tax=Cichlidogyrus casuarinus TaxID=1844966 RepID=A0ABD2QAM6_9PLAT
MLSAEPVVHIAFNFATYCCSTICMQSLCTAVSGPSVLQQHDSSFYELKSVLALVNNHWRGKSICENRPKDCREDPVRDLPHPKEPRQGHQGGVNLRLAAGQVWIVDVDADDVLPAHPPPLHRIPTDVDVAGLLLVVIATATLPRDDVDFDQCFSGNVYLVVSI